MGGDLAAALCLVLVIEGLVLFVAPRAWQRMMQDATQLDPRVLRIGGAAGIALGLLALHFVQ